MTCFSKVLEILKVEHVKEQISVNLTKGLIYGNKMILKDLTKEKPEYNTKIIDGITRK